MSPNIQPISRNKQLSKNMEVVHEICKLTVSAIASAVVCAMKFANSFARRHHLFVIAAKPINGDSKFRISSGILLHCSCSSFAHASGSDFLRQISSKFVL